MKVHTHEAALAPAGQGHASGVLIGETQGCVKGFCLGISYYDKPEYGQPGVHEDQEGFYVLAGTGMAKVGDEEFPIRPGSAFLAAQGVPHTMKRDPKSGPIKVLWTHGAV